MDHHIFRLAFHRVNEGLYVGSLEPNWWSIILLEAVTQGLKYWNTEVAIKSKIKNQQGKSKALEKAYSSERIDIVPTGTYTIVQKGFI